jgi:glutaredoxin 3
MGGTGTLEEESPHARRTLETTGALSPKTHLAFSGGCYSPRNTMSTVRRFGMAAAAAAFIAFAAFGSASASKPASFVKSTVKAHDVVIFSKSYCP